jgi:hypothetical protein
VEEESSPIPSPSTLNAGGRSESHCLISPSHVAAFSRDNESERLSRDENSEVRELISFTSCASLQ